MQLVGRGGRFDSNDSSSTRQPTLVSDAKFVHASCTEVIFLSTVATHFAPFTYLQVSARSCSARPTTAAYVDLLLLRRLRLLLRRRRRRRRRAIRGSAVRRHPPRFGSDETRSDAKVADDSRHRRIAQQHLMRWVHKQSKQRTISQSPACRPTMDGCISERIYYWLAS